MSLFELRNIRKSYSQGGIFNCFSGFGRGPVRVLDGLNLAVEPGRCLGLLGASGCGKSTAGRLLLGLEEPEAGQVFYKGRDLSRMSREEKYLFRRGSQAVFQNSHDAVNPRFRAWSIVTEPLSNFERLSKPELRERAAGLLVKVGLTESDMDKFPHQFSGGELQRVCIARALSPGPEFILLDEAVSSLDMLNQSLILGLLSELKESTGAAFLFISHDLRVLLKVCDSLAVMHGGRISSYIENLSELTELSENAGAFRDPALSSLARAVLPAEPR